MEETCWSCGEGAVVTDPDSGARICNHCGREHDAGAAEFVDQPTFTADGRLDRRSSSLVYHSSASPYRDRKLAEATAVINTIATRLGLSPSRAAEALSMALSATSGSLACPTTAFLPALAAACSLLVARSHRLPLSLAEAASAASCTTYSLSDLTSRLSRHLSLPPLPSFDYAAALDRAVRYSPSLSAAAAAADKTELILVHARFLLCCAAKWSLTTGRYPLPLIAAVAAFAAQINGVTSVSVDDIASEISAGSVSSHRRLKELTNALVCVARALLPWGADVNAKNLVQNAPLLLRLMEMRSRSDHSELFLEGFAPDMEATVQEYASVDNDESKYFQVVPTGHGDLDYENFGEDEKGLEDLKISKERLSDAYHNALKNLTQLQEAGEVGRGGWKMRQPRGLELETWIDLPNYKNMSLEDVMGMEVGYDAPPPSFTASVESKKLRRARIEAAKCRINALKKAPSAMAAGQADEKSVNDSEALGKNEEVCLEQKVGRRKRGRKRKDGSNCIHPGDSPAEKTICGKKRRKIDCCDGIDWEDCVIELLLLHGAREGEIEQGQYRRLLDLHVFSAACGGR